MTAALYMGAQRFERENAQLELEQLAGARAAVVNKSFHNATEAVYSVNQLFLISDDVSREMFEAFSRPIIARNPYVQALVFHRLVRAEEREAFEAQRRAIFPGFMITERSERGGIKRAVDRPEYLVDDYIVPMHGNQVALGYDVYSYPPQRASTQRAIDAGPPFASTFIPLLQGPSRGVLIVMPVYRRGSDLSTVAARRRAFIGDTEAVIDATQLIEQSLRDARLLDTPGVTLAVFGPGEGNVHELAFSNGIAARAPQGAAWFGEWGARTFSQVEWFDVAGQRWKAVITYRPQGLASHLGSLATLFFGTVLSIFTAAYTRAHTLRAKRIERLVEERTADLRRATDSLRLHKRAIESSANAVIIARAVGPAYPIEYVNPAFERAFGYCEGEVLGRPLLSFGMADPNQPGIDELRGAVRDQREAKAFLQHRRKDGTVMLSDVYIAPVRDQRGITEHFVLIQYDITTAKTYEAELEFHAKFDALTGLANRWVLYDRLERAVTFASAGGDRVWTVMIDLDQFKFVNDSLGHQTGDNLLRALAPRIVSVLRPMDTVARIGGDEFVLVLTGPRTEAQVTVVVEAVMKAIAAPLEVDGYTCVVTCSAGVSVFPSDGRDADVLLKHAEIAMYRSKELGRHTVQFYTAAMNARADERLRLEYALRSALVRDEFELHYQPQVEVASGEIVGVEALIRWHHPTIGMIRPDRFIALAEETGMIDAIGAWVLRTACFQNKRWQRAGFDNLRVAVNLSARQFLQSDLTHQVATILGESGLAPGCLEIEVTESLIMTNIDQAVQAMHQLKELGIKLSIDDFGTGYSSLSYLKSFPVDVLKIDQSFVRDISTHPDHAVMVGAIISLAHSLRLEVIAEGVETEEQLAYLRRYGCDEVQGYLVGRAVPVEHFERMLMQRGSISGQAGSV